ncbi:mediator of RNA polymerase II transcription subunit 18 [Spathaspora passalidarum NRRL Y-27907]|uniref:Mediator of RNA polymerase II transcription subunit 18 n=1 Tax=Spathaspora passalidarum (strain NRRL Y-27907 / 11-Y1) TaxID=619300 RepID=G3AMD3_SPAPN|nr:mediator of RNA polymerase II transcription subunit 18 [Spathaspora passalidarum NRRL Y-27907]EGW32784.1 mediator of RNA polymerase II transcription subunit 18 [Spathaspora passalidarum NRRL Y-27907]
MVHQLSLVSSIPHNKYLQTISTLQALTGLVQPQPISTYTLISKPSTVFKPKFEPGKVNQIEQYFMKCITNWRDDSIDISKPILKDGDIVSARRLFRPDDKTERVWTLQISDIPIAGKNQGCCQQTVYESTLVHTHTRIDLNLEDKVKEGKDDFEDFIEIDPPEDSEVDSKKTEDALAEQRRASFLVFLQDLGYEVINQFWIKGIRFFHGDIIIEIFKVLIRDDTTANNSTAERIKLKLLDESNTFQIRVYMNVSKSTDVEQINHGTKELIKLQEFLKNLFILEIPDRIFMDSRVTLTK